MKVLILFMCLALATPVNAGSLLEDLTNAATLGEYDRQKKKREKEQREKLEREKQQLLKDFKEERKASYNAIIAELQQERKNLIAEQQRFAEAIKKFKAIHLSLTNSYQNIEIGHLDYQSLSDKSRAAISRFTSMDNKLKNGEIDITDAGVLLKSYANWSALAMAEHSSLQAFIDTIVAAQPQAVGFLGIQKYQDIAQVLNRILQAHVSLVIKIDKQIVQLTSERNSQ
ncbi:MAG: hypothetical protein VX642_04635 [Bdellovibrionota bacterium]|nr:hypothetical protein [Bdellovibrionota bacterium]